MQEGASRWTKEGFPLLKTNLFLFLSPIYFFFSQLSSRKSSSPHFPPPMMRGYINSCNDATRYISADPGRGGRRRGRRRRRGGEERRRRCPRPPRCCYRCPDRKSIWRNRNRSRQLWSETSLQRYHCNIRTLIGKEKGTDFLFITDKEILLLLLLLMLLILLLSAITIVIC